MSDRHPFRHIYSPTGPDRACATCGWKPKPAPRDAELERKAYEGALFIVNEAIDDNGVRDVMGAR